MEQKHRHWLAHNVRAPDYNAVFAADVHPGAFDKLHTACGRARQKIEVANHDFTDVYGVECVNVLFKAYSVNNRGFVDMAGKRKLDKNTVDFFVGIKRVNKL